jgi:hypothetical protein
MKSLPLKCRCGEVHGALDVEAGGYHGVCYCDDCQAYAKTLGREDILDAWGGTEVYQTTPAHLHITGGAEQIRCLRLSESGMLRWHTACCQTPIANTAPWAALPFVGVVGAFVDAPREVRDEQMGKAEGVQGKFARGGCPPGAHPSGTLTVIASALGRIARGFVLREHKPSPFFNDDGQPVTPPYVLTPEENAVAHHT